MLLVGFINKVGLQNFEILYLDLQCFQLHLFFSIFDLSQSFVHLLFLPVYPLPFFFVLFSLIVLLVFLIDIVTIGLFLVESIEIFDGGINEINEFHLHLEAPILLELQVSIIYFFMEVLYLFCEVNWSIAVIHGCYKWG